MDKQGNGIYEYHDKIVLIVHVVNQNQHFIDLVFYYLHENTYRLRFCMG